MTTNGKPALCLLAAGIVAVTTLISCRQPGSSPATPHSTAQPLRKVSLRLAWVPDMAEAGVFVAKTKGHFRREGLEVTIEPGGFGLDPLKLVATGSSQFGVCGAGNLLLARDKGLPVVAIGVEFQRTPVGFITKKEAGIKNFRAFRGKRVGVQTGADTDVLYRALLARNGMSQKDVTEIPIQYEMTPFVAGTIDVLPGYITNQPITLRSKGIPVEVISAASEGLSYYGNVFFTTEETLAREPDLVAAVVRALRAGWENALASKPDAVAAVAAHTKDFNPADLDPIYDAVMPFIRPDEPGTAVLGMTLARWNSTAEVLRDAGLSKASLPTAGAFTTAF